MKKLLLITIFWCCYSAQLLFGQVGFTANDNITPYNEPFRAGANFGLYIGFTDEDLSDLAAGRPDMGLPGVGVKALRPGFFEHFTYQWGYDIRLSTFQHYENNGLKDNTIIVGFPAEAHRDQTQYCPGIRSELFANLYTPIWDNGANGTPVNENNYYAVYLYNLAIRYKDYVKFYEIWNEPGFDYTSAEGWFPPGEPGNWWDNDPNPCSYKLRAPIEHYVRMLRISWEVVKSVDPSAYIVISGLGYASFLDAILRNTDNPAGGGVSPEYPLGGGAYFDVLGMHAYPHFDGSLREWDNSINGFRYFRHSDAAAEGLMSRQSMFQEVLDQYGYNDITYPKKLSTITECNIPRRQKGNYIGGDIPQRNFIMKAVFTCMKNKINQLHIFKIAELADFGATNNEFDAMGLYEMLQPASGLFQTPTQEGIALRTTTDVLFEKNYDSARTAAMNLPDGIMGGAFKGSNNNYTYMLWAKTEQDFSENSNAIYSFPASFNATSFMKKEWNYGYNLQEQQVSSQNIALSGTPIFLTAMAFSTDFEECAPATINFMDESGTDGTSWEWTFEGGNPSFSSEQNPTVVFENPGQYNVSLTVRDALGNIIANQSSMVTVNSAPQATFTTNVVGTLVQFDVDIEGEVTEYFWDFGDGFTSAEANPNHVYAFDGNYTISLTVGNECGSNTATLELDIMTTTTSNLDFSANDTVPPYEKFLPGVRLNYYAGWNNRQLADIAAGNPNAGTAGAGMKALRTSLPENLFDFAGYDVQVGDFQHYGNLGLNDNAVILGYPSNEVRDDTEYCPGLRSQLFKNLYQDIWDDGTDGTPVNENNYYADYVYKTVIRYGPNVRFWEIWESPDIDRTGQLSFLEPGQPGNWWENDPDPCDYALAAPIYHYIRMLRISYEVIKTLQPDAYISLAGFNNPSFLDVILRNTDNPVNGDVTADFPLTGGAYFDAFSYSVLPHLDGSVTFYSPGAPNNLGYQRHSDAALSSISDLKEQFRTVFENRGYGNAFPEKIWNIDRINLPRRQFQDYIGSDETQRNYLMKAYVETTKNNISQYHVRQIAEEAPEQEATSEMQLMGLYEHLSLMNTPYQQTPTLQAIGQKTTSDLLCDKTYDVTRTAALQLPFDVNGAAFRDEEGVYTYMLWAVTMTDLSEDASAIYSFPASLEIQGLERRTWDFSQTPIIDAVNPAEIELTGIPIFLTETDVNIFLPIANFMADVSTICPGETVNFTSLSQNAENLEWSFPGGNPASSNETNPVVIYETPGLYEVSLIASNADGDDELTIEAFIEVFALPMAGFEFIPQGSSVQFTNTSTNADSYTWQFGDGENSMEINPTHLYEEDGDYEVLLIAQNANCEPDTFIQNIVINANAVAAAFNAQNSRGCPDLSVQFNNLSANATDFQWTFEGGEPATSVEPNPTVLYDFPGNYPVTLIASNEEEADTLVLTNFVQVDTAAMPNFEFESVITTVTFMNTSIYGETYLWDFGDGETSTDPNPVHTFEEGETYTVTLTAFNSICPPNTFSRVISFAPPPIPMFDTNLEGGCPGITVQFTDLSENATEWSWTFDGAEPSTSDEQNPIVTYTEPGIHNVTLGVSNASGTNAITFLNVIEIDTAAVAMFTVVQNSPTINFINESLYATEYEWSFGDGTMSDEAAPSHLFTDNGEYEVILAAFNPTCGWDTARQIITILEPPIIAFEINEQEDCDDVEIEFMDISEYSPTMWAWSFPGAIPDTSNEQSPIVLYENSGEYEVTLTVSNEAGSETQTQTISINTHLFLEESYEICEDDTLFVHNTFFTKDNPVGTVLLEGDGIENCDTVINVEVSLLENVNVAIRDTILEGDTLLFGSLILTEQGTYTQNFPAANGCDSTVFLRLIVLPRGLFKPLARTPFYDWNVFPNPFDEVVHFSFYLEKRANVRLEIFDTYGRQVAVLVDDEKRDKGQYALEWKTEKEVSGVYWCRVMVGEMQFWEKIVKR